MKISFDGSVFVHSHFRKVRFAISRPPKVRISIYHTEFCHAMWVMHTSNQSNFLSDINRLILIRMDIGHVLKTDFLLLWAIGAVRFFIIKSKPVRPLLLTELTAPPDECLLLRVGVFGIIE